MSTVSYGSGSTMLSTASSGGIGLSRTSTPPISGINGGFNSSPYYAGNHSHSRRQTPPYYPQNQPSVQHVMMGASGNHPYPGPSHHSRDAYTPQHIYGDDCRGEGDGLDSSPPAQYGSSSMRPRRRQTIPFPIHRGMDVLPSLPETHSSDIDSPSSYGQLGLPDPYAPAFLPSRYR